jgi:MurNAc alpha-1-phosphate uridylyltransferase
MPTRAMVLAAGFGLRMRPITTTTPKPLIPVAGRTLLDRALDRLEEVGVERVVVNVHHLADRIAQHVKRRKTPEIVLSREEELLETGGGVRKALPLLGDEPFYVVNSDTLWLNGPKPALQRLAARWDDGAMDAVLLVHSTVDAYGYVGTGDFVIDPDGKVTRPDEREVAPFLFAGVQLIHPRAFEGAPEGKFSFNVLYEKMIERQRLYAVIHDGEWFHVGTPEGLAEAEAFMRERYPGMQRR